MLTDTTVGFLGAGNMAEAIIRGVLDSGSTPPSQVVASDIRADRLEQLQGELGLRTTGDNRELVATSDIVVLSVKPQVLPHVVAPLAGEFRPSHTVVSIAAGITVASLEALVGEGVPVVRVMPNTPALVGEGASGFCLGRHANDRHAGLVTALLEATGLAVAIEEPLMDALTAISGSGPAYVFYLMEAMMAGAAKVGLPDDLARALVKQTVLGAARLAFESEVDPAELRRRVTSPGGTTQAAIGTLDSNNVSDAVTAAIVAARNRGIELGQK